MKLLIVVSALLATSMAQRPSFAGTGSVGAPNLASRFQNTSGNSSTATQSNLANRFGDNSDASTPRIPTDARGDVALVNRLNTWPVENRPFWLLNADHIERSRYPNGGAPIDRISSTQNSRGVVETTPKQIFVDSRIGQDPQPAQESFTVIRNNKLRTYVYDPVSDSWKAISS